MFIFKRCRTVSYTQNKTFLINTLVCELLKAFPKFDVLKCIFHHVCIGKTFESLIPQRGRFAFSFGFIILNIYVTQKNRMHNVDAFTMSYEFRNKFFYYIVLQFFDKKSEIDISQKIFNFIRDVVEQDQELYKSFHKI